MEANDIRELLRQGHTGQALEALLVWIRKDARYKNNLARTLEVLQVGYERVRQQELRHALGALSYRFLHDPAARVPDYPANARCQADRRGGVCWPEISRDLHKAARH